MLNLLGYIIWKNHNGLSKVAKIGKKSTNLVTLSLVIIMNEAKHIFSSFIWSKPELTKIAFELK